MPPLWLFFFPALIFAIKNKVKEWHQVDKRMFHMFLKKSQPLPLGFEITRVELISSLSYAICPEEVERVPDFICLQWFCFCSISY